MTEADWLAATDPRPMLEFLRDRGKASERKLRLFACACCRRVWHRLPDGRTRGAVEVSERYADGAAREDDLDAAMREAEAAWLAALSPRRPGFWGRLWRQFAGPGADFAAEVVRCQAPLILTNHRGLAAPAEVAERLGRAGRFCALFDSAEQCNQAALLRCIFGNPLRPGPPLAPAVLSWDGGTVAKLAAAIYEERAFDRLPVLADALEDAGCADAEILGHCRGGGEHVRGCWVVDLALGKG
jgi:hypothetical protein